MRRFHFRLASLQDLRRHSEQESKDRLMRERLRLTELMRESDRIMLETRRWSQRYLKMAQQGIRPIDSMRIDAYLSELARLKEENEKAVGAQESVVEKARADLTDKMKERKTIDRLRERQMQSFMLEESRRDEKLLEDQIQGRMTQNAW